MHDPQVSEGTSSLVLWAMRMRSDPTNDELVQHFVDRQRRSPRRFIGTKNKEPLMTPFPLLSDGPHEDLSPSDRLFEPFIGSWDLDVTWYDRGAVTRRASGEWHFAWVLEGRAVQDVWVVPPRGQRHGTDDLYEYGTSIRFPDPSCGGWRSTWVGPMQRVVRTFVARPSDGDVVLKTRLEDGRQMQWRFSDITPTSFVWSNATEKDGEWMVTQRFTARRVPDTSLA